jgi:hypothetical protein
VDEEPRFERSRILVPIPILVGRSGLTPQELA